MCVCAHVFAALCACVYIHVYDYMPKGVQEKRTEVLENKVDRMRVSNAFSE